MKAILSFALSVMLSLATGCGTPESTAVPTVASAEAALTSGDIARAVEISDRLSQTVDSANLTWHDYCLLATVYSVAYNADIAAGESMASATHCYGRAVALNADSAASYTPDNEYFTAFEMMRHVYGGQLMDDSDIADHEEYTDDENPAEDHE